MKLEDYITYLGRIYNLPREEVRRNLPYGKVEVRIVEQSIPHCQGCTPDEIGIRTSAFPKALPHHDVVAQLDDKELERRNKANAEKQKQLKRAKTPEAKQGIVLKHGNVSDLKKLFGI